MADPVPDAPRWQPINDAPRTGRKFRARLDDGTEAVVQWAPFDGWRDEEWRKVTPTHWLADAPRAQAREKPHAHIETCIRFYCDERFEDERQDRDEALAYLAALRDEHARLTSVLKDLEWIGMNDGRGVTHLKCPACSALKSRGSGHNPFCGLAAALTESQ